MKTLKGPVVLIIFDGFGYRIDATGNAITCATMPFFFSLLDRYPWTTLEASGTAVGLPAGTPGNSAVGHFTLGAGKVVEQPLTQFLRLIEQDKLCSLPSIKKHFTELARTGKALHIIGLMSDGSSHSRLIFTQAMITCARAYGIKNIKVHAILDGRDVPQKSAAQFLSKIDAPIVSMQGRLYAMDRNKDPERINRAYAIISTPEAQHPQTWQTTLEHYYHEGLYDEIIPPTQLSPDAYIEKGDGVVMVNIRADRGRELYDLLKKNTALSFIITGIHYEDTPDEESICTTQQAQNTLGDYLEKHQIPCFTVAESEKYAHVTYFLNGGREAAHPLEKRTVLPSDNPVNFVHEPAMQARAITQTLINEANKNSQQFFIVNYANADMVGHSGNLQATEQAVSVLDEELKKLYDFFVEQCGGTLYITGDHGNAEDKRNNNPAHTTDPVYFVIVSKTAPAIDIKQAKTLADIKEFIIKNSLES